MQISHRCATFSGKIAQVRRLFVICLFIVPFQVQAQTPDPCETGSGDLVGYDPQDAAFCCEIVQKISNKLADDQDKLLESYRNTKGVRADSLGQDAWLLNFWYGGSYEDVFIYSKKGGDQYHKMHHIAGAPLYEVLPDLNNGLKDIKLINPSNKEPFEYTLCFDGMQYDTCSIYGVTPPLYHALGIEIWYKDTSIQVLADEEFRFVSGSEKRYKNDFWDEDNLYYLLYKKDKTSQFKLMGAFPVFPSLNMPGNILDVYNDMPVFKTKSEHISEKVGQLTRLHYFDGRKYVGEIRYDRIDDENYIRENYTTSSEEFGFEILKD